VFLGSKPDETEKLVVGGQEGIYPAKMCVDLLRCLLAARTFTETGKLEPLVSWEEDIATDESQLGRS
jgi:hypothetical protein